MNSNLKGKRGERDAAHALNEAFPGVQARRGQQFKGTPDSPDIVAIDGVHLEVKRVERGLNLEAALKQASQDKHEAETPAVLHRRNRERWKITLWLEDLPGLWKALSKLYGEGS